MWTDQQRAELAKEYARIGHREGDMWPTPANGDDPEAYLSLLRRVPTGSGLAGYLEILRGRAAD
jgi:hypothetical protein